MKNQNRSDYTIKTTDKALTTISKHANLNEPETVKQFIANKQNVSEGYKKALCIAYNKYCQYYKIEWEMPLYKLATKIRRIPTTENIEKLIARAGKTLSLKLRISKETGLRPIEIHMLKVKDIDTDQRTIYPTTAKNGSARTLKISSNLSVTLQNHISTNKLNQNDKLFRGDAERYGKYYRQMRNSLAKKLNNQTLKTIRLYDFRHYYATRLYAKTRDILFVQQQMGHRQLRTTLIYVQLLNLNDDEWTCKTANNVTQATQLIENGFEYVAEKDGTMLFRKRK